MENRLFKLLMGVLSLSTMSQAADYFVSTEGDDGNVGSSVEQSFATINHALEQMYPGDRCYIGKGTYHEYGVISEWQI